MNIEQLIGHVAGRFAQGMRPDDPSTRRYAEALKNLAEHALTKWLAVSAAGMVCGSELRHKRTGAAKRCGAPAAGSCVVCNRATCIDHAMVSPSDGRLICHGCVMAVASSYSGQPDEARAQSEARIRGALRTLGLEPGATVDEIRAAHKELAKRHHPDRQPPSERADAERFMKTVNEAYSILVRHYEREAAA
jgi:hypothetical protein